MRIPSTIKILLRQWNGFMSAISMAFFLSALSFSAGATVISGDFTGIARGPQFEGQSVSGSFYFNTAQPLDWMFSGTDQYAYTKSGGTKLTFNIGGTTLHFDDVDALGMVAIGYGGNLLELQTGAFYPAGSASIVLKGDLFDGTDLESFHPNPVDLEGSSAQFTLRFFGAANIDLTSVTFADNAVPEPPVPLLLVVGAVCLWIARRGKVTVRPVSLA